MTPPEFISASVRGGWKAEPLELRHWETCFPSLSETDKARLIAQVLLDPLAWSAVFGSKMVCSTCLGETKQRPSFLYECVEHGLLVEEEYAQEEYKLRQHLFLDLLQSGQTLLGALRESTI